MAKTFRTIAVCLKREILSVRFFACSLLCALFMIFFVYGDYKNNFSGLGLYYFLQGVDYSGAIFLLVMVVVLPVSTIFCEDWESGLLKFHLPRCGRGNYALSITVSAGITSGLCMFLAYLVFSVFILTKYPLVPKMDESEVLSVIYSFPNGTLLVNGHEILCYLIYFLTKSAMAAFFGVLTVLQSVIITNKRFTIISPVIMDTLLSVITAILKLPTILDPLALYNRHLQLYMAFGGSLDNMFFSPISALYPSIYCCLSIMIVTLCVSLLIKRKVGNKI